MEEKLIQLFTDKGYSLESNEKGYLKFNSIGAKSKQYNDTKYEQLLGNRQVVIYINISDLEKDGFGFMGIKHDCETRNVYNGRFITIEDVERILYLSV